MGELSTQTTDFEKTDISGQAVLPGFQAILDCESMALSKPEHEVFCVRYVESGGDSAKAYQQAINSDVTDRLSAQKNAHKLLKRGEIKRRIAEISAVMRNRDIEKVLSFQRRAMDFDPADYLDPVSGGRVPLYKLPEHKRRGIGLEARVVDGGIVYLPVFPNPQKAAESMSKMMGIEKQLVELTGKDGGPVEHRHSVDDAMLEAIALGKA
jgi:hypothetical protein